MEATGAYSAAPALALCDAGRTASVVNPARVKYAGLVRGRGNKTDKADARLIADSAVRERPAAWVPPPPAVRELQAFLRRRDDLRAMAARDAGRLDSPARRGAARKSVERTITVLAAEAAKVQAAADALIAASPDLAADHALLDAILGVGPHTASTVVAELPHGARGGRVGRRLRRLGPPRVPERHLGPPPDPPVEGRQRTAP